MAVNDIMRELERDAKAEAAGIRKEAEKQADQIISKAEKEAQSILQTAREEAGLEAARIAQEKSVARLEAKKILANAEMEVYGMVSRRVREKLFASVRKNSKAYEKFVEKAAREGRKMVGENCVIMSNKRDAKLAKRLGQLSPKPLDCAGGIIVASPDGRVRADSTLEAVFSEHELEIVTLAKGMIRTRA